MLEIEVSGQFFEEKKYVVEILIGEFLGLPYQLVTKEQQNNFVIKAKTGQLIIEDHFFNTIGENSYLQTKFLPSTISYLSHSVFDANRIPVLYGKPEIRAEEHSLTCKADLFASAFFMLTRWEEYVKPDRDQYQRFPLKAALAYQHSFHQRAVVNEYTALLFRFLKHLDPSLAKQKRIFTITPTHDIDSFWRWRSFTATRKSLAHNFFTQKRMDLGVKNIRSAINTILNFEKDPYLTFDYLDEKASDHEVPAHFYFMTGGKTKYDNNYSISHPDVIRQIAKLHQAGHIIGIHPSFDSYKDADLLRQEKEKL